MGHRSVAVQSCPGIMCSAKKRKKKMESDYRGKTNLETYCLIELRPPNEHASLQFIEENGTNWLL